MKRYNRLGDQSNEYRVGDEALSMVGSRFNYQYDLIQKMSPEINDRGTALLDDLAIHAEHTLCWTDPRLEDRRLTSHDHARKADAIHARRTRRGCPDQPDQPEGGDE